MRAFLVVAEEPSLRRAAARLHLSQPALSERIVRLEQSLGTTLLERHPTGSTLTPAGRRMLPVVRDAVRALDEVLAAAAAGPAADVAVPATVRVGVHADGVQDLTWPVLQAVGAWTPAPQLVLVRMTWTDCVPSLVSGAVDAVLARGPFGTERLDVTTLAWSPVGVLLSSRHELADAGTLDPATVAEAPTLRPPDGVDRTFRQFWTQEDVHPGRQVLGKIDAGIPDLVRHVERSGAVGLFPTALAGMVASVGAAFRPLTQELRSPLQVLTLPGNPRGRALAATARAVASRLVPHVPGLHSDDAGVCD